MPRFIPSLVLFTCLLSVASAQQPASTVKAVQPKSPQDQLREQIDANLYIGERGVKAAALAQKLVALERLEHDRDSEPVAKALELAVVAHYSAEDLVGMAAAGKEAIAIYEKLSPKNPWKARELYLDLSIRIWLLSKPREVRMEITRFNNGTWRDISALKDRGDFAAAHKQIQETMDRIRAIFEGSKIAFEHIPLTGDYLRLESYVLAAEGKRPEAQKMKEAALSVYEAGSGTKYGVEQRRLHFELGKGWLVLNDLEKAEQQLRMAAEIAGVVLPPDRPERAVALAEVAGILASKGEEGRAFDIATEAAEFARNTPSLSAEQRTAILLIALNVTVRCKRNDEAIALGEEIKKILEQAKQKGSSDYCMACINIGHALVAKKQWKEAATAYRETYALAETAKETPFMAHGLFGLARCSTESGDLDGAQVQYEKAIALFREILGPNSQLELSIQKDLAGLTRRRIENAYRDRNFQAVREACAKREEYLKKDTNPEFYTVRLCQLDLASLDPVSKLSSPDYAEWLAARKVSEVPLEDLDPKPPLKEREQQVRKAIATFERLLGKDYYLVPIMQGELGRILYDEQEWTEAESMLTEAIAGLQNGWPAAHPHLRLPRCQYFLGLSQVRYEAEVPQGIANLERAALGFRALFGLGLGYVDCLEALVNARYTAGDYSRAETNAVELLELQGRLRGKNSDSALAARRELGKIRLAQGDGTAALEHFSELVRIGPTLSWSSGTRAYDLGLVGQAHVLKGDAVQGEKFLKEAIALYTPEEQAKLWTFGLSNADLGQLYLKQGKIEAAQKHLEAAAANYESFPNFNWSFRQGVRVSLARIQVDQAQERETACDPVKANEHRKAALAHLKKLFTSGGWVLRLHEQYIKSNEKWAKLTGNARAKVDATVKQFAESVRLNAQGERQEAYDMLPKVADGFATSLGKDDIRWAFTQLEMAGDLYKLVRWPESATAAEAAIGAFDKLLQPDNFHSADLQMLIGNTKRFHGDVREATPYYTKAFKVFNTIDRGGLEMSLALLRLAQCRLSEDQPQAAYADMALATRNLRIYSPRQPALFVDALASLSELSARLGDFDWAKVQAEEALEFVKARKLEGTEAEIRAARGMARLFLEWKKPEEAEKHARRWVELARKLLSEKDGEATQALLALGNALLQKGDGASAEAFAKQALDRASQWPGVEIAAAANARILLAEIQYDLGEWKNAATMATEALTEFEKQAGPSHRRTIWALELTARIQIAQGKLAEAAKTRARTLTVAMEALDRVSSVATGDQLIELAGGAREALYAYLSLPASEQSAELAYNGLLRLKGAAFTRQQQLRVAASDPSRADLATAWRNAGSELATEALAPPYQEGSRVWLQSLALRLETLNNLESQLAAGVQPLAPVTVEDIAKTLPDDAVLVDYLLYPYVEPSPGKPSPSEADKPKTELRYVAFVLKKDKPLVRVDLGNSEAVAQAVTDWRNAIEELNDMTPAERFSKAVPQAREIFSRVAAVAWNPLAEAVGDAKAVYLSPDGPLAAIPFAALPGSQAESFLIEERSILVVPAARMLVDAKPGKNSDPSLMVVGQVDYGAAPGNVANGVNSVNGVNKGRLGGFTKLTEDHLECSAVNTHFEKAYPKAKHLYLTEKEPTENTFRHVAGDHRWVHVSTHGFYFEENVMMSLGQQMSIPGLPSSDLPGVASEDYSMRVLQHPGLQCGIGLAGANVVNRSGEDDGVLTAFEVSMLDLSGIDSLMLSACQTALGSTRNGEGVLGLQRAFHQAGVHSVIATLWSVSVGETIAFVDVFYGHLWNDHKVQAEALQLTQMEFIQYAREVIEKKGDRPDHIHPFYWAGFSMSGDGK